MKTLYIIIIFIFLYILTFIGVVMSQIRLNEKQKDLDKTQKQIQYLLNL